MADLPLKSVKQPAMVTVAIVILGALFTLRALNSLMNISMIADPADPGSIAYIIYLATMVLVPAFFLVKIAMVADWARIAFLTLFVLDLAFRVFLFVNDGHVTLSSAVSFAIPSALVAVGLALLFIPPSNRWLQARNTNSLVQTSDR